MNTLRNFVTPLHELTRRKYVDRMIDEKVLCMKKAKQYGYDYWDGDRRYGYGGYRYIPGRWKPVAEQLVSTYGLTEDSSVLDIGCGKGYILHELGLLLPGLTLVGLDISQYGITESKEEIRDNLIIHRAQDAYPFLDDEFDLVLSIGCLHNLKLMEIEKALGEIERVGCESYLLVESYRNEEEQFNLQCWALTAETLIDIEAWDWLFQKCCFSGDYEFIYFK